MKKKLVTVLLASSMVATMLAGCGSGSGDGTEKGSSAKGGDGSVYMLNFKPETDQAWQDLAEKYTDETGVKVTVVTAADGQYKTTLKSELAKKDAPTIFNIGSTADCAEYDKYIYDLKDSEIYKHLTDKSLALEYNGKIASVANCYECYGIIYNKAMLEKYCKNYSGAVIKSVDDIKDLDTLEKVATDINEHVDDINKACDLHLTEAFASAGLDSGSNWRFTGHLAGLALYYEFKDAGCDLTAGQKEVTGKYMDNFKRVWDMYTNTSAADKATLDSGSLNAESELGMEEAVFYQNGDWEYANFADDNENGYTVKQSDLSMMPIYFGVDDENEGLAVGTENHWTVNAKADQKDIDATLEFLNWVISTALIIEMDKADMDENYTYIVRCADGTLYTGWTNDLKKRIKAHNSGKGAKYTKTRRPVELVYFEHFATKEEAMSREYHIKQLKRAQKQALIDEMNKNNKSIFTQN